MNDINSQSQNITKENFGPIENSNNHKVKEIKFIKLIMFSCFISLGFINHIGYYLNYYIKNIYKIKFYTYIL